jgi:cytochrome P450 family 6
MFSDILLELRKTASLTVSELAAESFIFFLGGFETSSSLSVFTMYELALNPDIQDKLRHEIKTGIEDNDGKLTYDLLFSFKYLDMVVNETLRKYPPAFIITRNSTKDFTIPGTEMTIPANTDININVLSIHRDPEYYPEPEKFDPERFTPENVKNRKPFTFIPFGDGPRKCIGEFKG